MEPRRILHIIDKSMIGGGQHNVLTLASGLNRTEFTPIVACSPGGPLVDSCRERNVEVWTIPMSKRFQPSSMWQLTRMIRRERIDLVHAHGLVATAFVAFPAKLAGVPVFYSQHGYHHRNYTGRVSRPLRIASEKFFIRRMQRVICDSAADREYGKRRGYFVDTSCAVLPPPVDLAELRTSEEEIAELRRRFGLAADRRVLGTVGRLDVAKGHTILLESLALLRKRIPDFRFLFVGDGPERARLEECARGLDLDENVAFLGRQESITPFLGLFDLYVSSSLWEGLPVAICEAMAMARPVVATRVGGCPEVVQHGETGLLVPPKDPEALAESLWTLLSDPAGRGAFGRAGRARIKDHFSTEAVLPRLEELYRSCLACGNAPAS